MISIIVPIYNAAQILPAHIAYVPPDKVTFPCLPMLGNPVSTWVVEMAPPLH